MQSVSITPQIAKFMGPTWGPPGTCRPQMGPMLAPWTLLSGTFSSGLNDPVIMWSLRYVCTCFSVQHYNDVIMNSLASQITSLTIVYSTIYSGPDQRKHQSSAWLAFVRGIHQWPVNSPHKGPVTRKMFPFDDVIMVWCVLFSVLLWSLIL